MTDTHESIVLPPLLRLEHHVTPFETEVSSVSMTTTAVLGKLQQPNEAEHNDTVLSSTSPEFPSMITSVSKTHSRQLNNSIQKEKSETNEKGRCEIDTYSQSSAFVPATEPFSLSTPSFPPSISISSSSHSRTSEVSSGKSSFSNSVLFTLPSSSDVTRAQPLLLSPRIMDSPFFASPPPSIRHTIDAHMNPFFSPPSSSPQISDTSAPNTNISTGMDADADPITMYSYPVVSTSMPTQPLLQSSSTTSTSTSPDPLSLSSLSDQIIAKSSTTGIASSLKLGENVDDNDNNPAVLSSPSNPFFTGSIPIIGSTTQSQTKIRAEPSISSIPLFSSPTQSNYNFGYNYVPRPLPPSVAGFTNTSQIRTWCFLLATDQAGSRSIQTYLDNNDEFNRHAFLNVFLGETLDQFGDIMCDTFGNYVAQKIAEYADSEQRERILVAIFSVAPKIAKTPHGTRAMQAFCENLVLEREQDMMIRSLKARTIPLCCDSNATHTMLKCINSFSTDVCTPIFEIAINNCRGLCTQQHGCAVYQACIERAPDTWRVLLVDAVIESAVVLMKDKYGNYVVQYVLENQDSRASVTRRILDAIDGCEIELCQQKFASNVMEKCIKTATRRGRQRLAAKLLSPENLVDLIQDRYSNYVMQELLRSGTPQERRIIAQATAANPHLQTTPYCRQIFALCCRMCPSVMKTGGTVLPSYGGGSSGNSNGSGGGNGNEGGAGEYR